jgi:hypothetical protein
MFDALLAAGSSLTVDYRFQFDFDAEHRCIVSLGSQTSVLDASHRMFSVCPEVKPPAIHTFLREGVLHIFGGIDHICFLLALMLPAVWRRTQNGWGVVESFKVSFYSIAKIVTSFTIAHSLTFCLAAVGAIVIPSVWVECVIALSVVIAALNNLWPLWNDRSWLVALGFGFIHGFGFAGAVADLPAKAVALAGFNLGVEAGQLVVVGVFLPLAYILRHSWFYRWCAMRGGSLAIATAGTIWLMERAFQIDLF